MRVLTLLLLVVLALCAGPVATAPEASAATPSALPADLCEDVDLTDVDQMRDKIVEADAVFEGRVTRVRARPGAGGGRFVHVVEVQVVYTGDVAAGDRVRIVTEGGANGLGRLPAKRRYLFLVEEGRGTTLEADQCSGTTRLGKRLPDAAREVIETVIDEQDGGDPGDRVRPVALDEPAGGTESPPSLGRAMAPGVALALLGVLGLLVLALGGRRTS